MMNWTVQRKSPLTGKINTKTFLVADTDLVHYEHGGLIQECFPYLSNSDREFIMTGYTDEDWKQIFAESEE